MSINSLKTLASSKSGKRRYLDLSESELDEFKFCVYNIEIADTIFQLHDKDADGLKLTVDQNNIDNMLYMID